MPKHARSCDRGPCPESKASTRNMRAPKVRGRKRGRPWWKTGVARRPKRRRTMPFLAAYYPSLRVYGYPCSKDAPTCCRTTCGCVLGARVPRKCAITCQNSTDGSFLDPWRHLLLWTTGYYGNQHRGGTRSGSMSSDDLANSKAEVGRRIQGPKTRASMCSGSFFMRSNPPAERVSCHTADFPDMLPHPQLPSKHTCTCSHQCLFTDRP